MRILKGLDLTDEQKASAREIMLAARKQAIPMRAELQVAQLELQELLVQDDVDRAAVDQHLDQIGNCGKSSCGTVSIRVSNCTRC